MKKALLAILCALALIGCKTYMVTPESFRQQFAQTDSAALQSTHIKAPALGLAPGSYTIQYLANNLTSIKVIDKKGAEVRLDNSPSLEMRVTLANGKRKYMYFDTAVIQNDTLYGRKSRYFSGLDQKIAFKDIRKIEIQDGGKKFSYQ
jgi:hypothetical protein